jgi:hypothetical protein
MRYRLVFFVVTVFFVSMNVLLWRSEFAQSGRLGPPVPADLVWDKVLTSPDFSFLEIRHHGVKIGRAKWAANVGEARSTGQIMSEEVPPEGMVRNLAGYTLDFDGSVSLEDLTRLHFTFTLKLDTNQDWREVSFKLRIKPYSWEVQASAVQQQLRLISDDDEGKRDRTYTFAELRNPEKFLRDLGGAGLPALFSALGVPLQPANAPGVSLGLNWEAREDRLRIGSTDVRVYRLEARLLGRYKAAFFVSRVGEILRVDLPDDIVLTNDALTNL